MSDDAASLIDQKDLLAPVIAGVSGVPVVRSAFGALYARDCMDLMAELPSEGFDTIFADPPFNIGKQYGGQTDDNRPEDDYIRWCRGWIDACVRVLKPGGALFIYNIPKWNLLAGAHLIEGGMTFRHDIAVEMKNNFKIKGRLYPSHYSLLYFTKGEPRVYRDIRTPIPRCRKCGVTVHDYGGHASKMNPAGVNLTDIWTDIPVVRHRKYKPKGRGENTLSTKMLERILSMTTYPGDLVFDPFGGAGTTFAVAERMQRYWVGAELNDAQVIADRLGDPTVCHHRYDDHVGP